MYCCANLFVQRNVLNGRAYVNNLKTDRLCNCYTSGQVSAALRSAREFGRKRGHLVVSAVGPAIFDHHVPALGVAVLGQTAMECLYEMCAFITRARAKKSDD